MSDPHFMSSRMRAAYYASRLSHHPRRLTWGGWPDRWTAVYRGKPLGAEPGEYHPEAEQVVWRSRTRCVGPNRGRWELVVHHWPASTTGAPREWEAFVREHMVPRRVYLTNLQLVYLSSGKPWCPDGLASLWEHIEKATGRPRPAGWDKP